MVLRERELITDSGKRVYSTYDRTSTLRPHQYLRTWRKHCTPAAARPRVRCGLAGVR